MPLAIILIAITFSSTFVASLITGFTRETSGVYERWNNHSPEANQALFDAANQIALNPNLTTRNDSAPTGSGDADGDGLTNDDEAGRELDPTNPDTDGDGTADGIELTLGTNPLDPASGGLGPVAGIVPILPSGQLILDSITKTVGGDHMASIPVGSEVTFTITAEAYLRGNISKTLGFEDILPAGLRFKSGTLIFNGTLQELDSWAGRQLFPLQTAGSYSLMATITAEVISTGTIANTARIFDANNPLNQLSSTAHIRAHPINQPPPAPPAIVSFTKLGRTVGGEWHGVVFANPNDTVEFSVVIETTQPNFTLVDKMPQGLRYIEDTLTLSFNEQVPQTVPVSNFFDTGFALNSAGRYEFRFFATVNSIDRFILTNHAKLLGLSTSFRSAAATIINRPT